MSSGSAGRNDNQLLSLGFQVPDPHVDKLRFLPEKESYFACERLTEHPDCRLRFRVLEAFESSKDTV